MNRMIRWRISGEYDEMKWTAKTRPYPYNGVDLSFTLIPGRYGGFINKNAKLIVRKKGEGKKVANKVILQREFDRSYNAKNVIDAMLTVTRILFDTVEEREKWFIDTLTTYKDPPQPEQPKNGQKIYRPMGYTL